MGKEPKPNRYAQIIERIFLARHRKGMDKVPFAREDIEQAARELGLVLPKNIGDLIYSFRFRTDFPASVAAKAPVGKSWMIRLVGRAQYCFAATKLTVITPRQDLAITKIPDATPGIITRYALSDEQALLAKLRYNRLVDIFSGVTCYSLQSHLRTAIPDMGQVETDEVYVGVDRRGAHYVLPVQAKGGADKQSVVQIEQDLAVCQSKFPSTICRPLAAQFMADQVIALFEFTSDGDEILILSEKHYQLVPQRKLTDADLNAYRRTPSLG